ncbi:MAG: Rne/Rng family ribonuclease [Parvularculaceae bacterium]
MTKTMLIDAANPEEVRVCVLQNGKVEDFDFESASRKPLRGNIYLARVTRVEPSLQAAFVEYGGNRHGFLAFNEIHPDYYQIPVSDRQQLQEAEAEEAALAAALNLADDGEGDSPIDEVDAALERERGARSPDDESDGDGEDHGEEGRGEEASGEDAGEPAGELSADETEHANDAADAGDQDDDDGEDVASDMEIIEAGSDDEDRQQADDEADEDEAGEDETDEGERPAAKAAKSGDVALSKLSRGQLIEKYKEARRKRARLLRNYKIQEVVKRRQILLVQAVKEERGNKGAALTTYLSLAGRYCVLMPNTARGGGISRKIPVAADRKRLKRIVDELEVSDGMGLIIRTAGAKRTKAEIKRDYDYLVRLWENIRTLTLKSIAPCLIYEEASLIKRAIRDLYDKDISSVQVEGDNGYREAKDFMKMLMPSHAKNVQPYKDKTPLFLKHGVESQLDAMYRPTVRLKSGGYIVINQTEALIAIDVNSGKATRERNIEQTALRTNLEAADEAARQCRLRDLAGLIVIDFIDMEESRNNRSVEKRLKDALRADRARIQMGRISGFGLLEMSRQRRRSGIVDGTTHMCPTCGGAGAVRSQQMAAHRILRSAEHEARSSKAGNLQIRAALDVTLYILNHKREWLRRIETDYGVSIELTSDSTKAGDNFEIEKTGVRSETPQAPVVVRADTTETIEPDDADEVADDGDAQAGEKAQDGEEKSGRRRRRRRRKRADGAARQSSDNADAPPPADDENGDEQPFIEAATDEDDAPARDEEERPSKKRRRRGRRGGRRGRRADQTGDNEDDAEKSADAIGPNDDNADENGESSGETAPEVSDGVEPAPEEIESAIAPDEAPLAQERDETPAPQVRPAEAAIEAPLEVEPARQPAAAEDAPAPAKSTRKGWWNRALG